MTLKNYQYATQDWQSKNEKFVVAGKSHSSVSDKKYEQRQSMINIYTPLTEDEACGLKRFAISELSINRTVCSNRVFAFYLSGYCSFCHSRIRGSTNDR